VLSALMLALLSAGNELWPTGCYRRIAALALIAAYTTFGEWLNVVVRASWAYSEWPPIVSAFGLRIGISPLLQWITVPSVGFAVTSVVTAKFSNGEP